MLAQLYMRKREYKTARQLFEQVANSNADEERTPAGRAHVGPDRYV